MKPCPQCGCDSELTLDSSSAAGASWIDCHNCEFHFQQRCDEETCAERWAALERTQMPAYTEGQEP